MIQVKTIAEARAQHGEAIQRVRKPRHFSRPLSAWWGAILLVASQLCFLAFGYLGMVMFVNGNRDLGYSAIAVLGLGVFLRLWAMWHCSRLVCNLCHGTVLREKRCLKHKEASKWPLLSHAATAAISIILTWRFSCMYCGTPYRLKK
jgi:hypothetical protein